MRSPNTTTHDMAIRRSQDKSYRAADKGTHEQLHALDLDQTVQMCLHENLVISITLP